MESPDFDAFPITHELLVKSAGYHEATATILSLVLRRASTGYVRIEHDQLEATFEDTPRCRETWEAVRDSLSWTEDAQGGAWYRGDLPETAGEFERLWSLSDGLCGVHFVHEVALYDEDGWLFYAVPHHTYCWLRDSKGIFISDVDDALASQRACVLPAETTVEWTRDGRNYSIMGTSLCVENGRLGTSNCYGLANLETVKANERARTLSLAWHPDPIPGLVGRALMGAMSLVYNPSERLQFEDEGNFRKVESVLREIIDKREATA
ncbi:MULTISPECIES: hypothetical protein [unclassified Haladaptatus]|uniref:hypothetical protein n=1 Tax=unclassified Haladaptatus TaxID=2622732 RepID=UPI00209BDFDB|nr:MULTISPECIES: hypothetical protein [unclassified Haladaptatus]MCO8245053.1 hypothetical protein [Haladaptatus sp. AB643]MCO8253195.1 hypothetical protein [Haladaptatus sp. AB618]